MRAQATTSIAGKGYRMIFSDFAEMINGRYISALVDHDTRTIRIAAEHCYEIKEALRYARETLPKPKTRKAG
jgi:hypothetical protein